MKTKEFARLAFTYLYISSSVLFLSSCSKGGAEEPRTGIYGQWMQTSGRYSPAFDGEEQYFPTGAPCFDDDILEVLEDGTYSVTEGASKCDPNSSNLITVGTFTVDGDPRRWTVPLLITSYRDNLNPRRD